MKSVQAAIRKVYFAPPRIQRRACVICQMVQDARAIIRAGDFNALGPQPWTIKAALAEIVEVIRVKLAAAHPLADSQDIAWAVSKALAFETQEEN